MGKTAFVFPGQASQYAGMGREARDAHPAAARVFEQADAALGFDLSRMCFEGPEDALVLTENTQPAILTVSAAVWSVLNEAGVRPDFVAGHSLGEYSALVAAGAIGFEDAVTAVRLRGRFMQEAVPVGVGAMAALLGPDLAQVEEICDQVRGQLTLAAANINCPGQIVIAGHREAVEQAVECAKGLGFRKAVLLPVSAPFHCELMRPAQERLEPELFKRTFNDPRVPLVSNVDAAVVADGVTARASLVRQVTAPVRWQASIEFLLEQGVDTFVEVGPKTVLSGMIRKINRDVRVLPAEKPAEIESVVNALGGGGGV